MRKYNFSAGPSALPEAVLKAAQQELLSWQQQGFSIMETSHRSASFMSVAQQAEADLRALMQIPDNYKVLFMQGGATAQFAMVPLNLLAGTGKADYINTGIWSKKAINEASKSAEINIAASAEANNFTQVPSQDQLQLDPEAAYVHYTPNETIGGLAFDYIPDTCSVPLVADFSSSILSESIDVSRFGLIYAGAQKNIGPAGLVLVIIREDLLARCGDELPSMMNYRLHAEADSMLNTPPTFAWYLAGLVLKWLQEQGGVDAMAGINKRKAAKLYAFIDQSDFYHNSIASSARSIMNVPFTLADDGLDKEFLAAAEQANLLNLKGHRSVGGMRASIYNAVPEAAVDALIEFMQQFAQQQS